MSELVDLVNSDGTVMERAVSRDEADKYDGLYMQIIIMVIRNSSGDILVHERAATKTVNPGDIDHVCGGIQSGETPEVAAIREALEEVGVAPNNIQLVRGGLNSYGRYCYLLRGESDEKPPAVLDHNEVTWADYISLDDLIAKNENGTLTFVDGFFDDITETSQPSNVELS
jgi:8-oxo-dGTP pyrophosphatase MutT (NUDIX family)